MRILTSQSITHLVYLLQTSLRSVFLNDQGNLVWISCPGVFCLLDSVLEADSVLITSRSWCLVEVEVKTGEFLHKEFINSSWTEHVVLVSVFTTLSHGSQARTKHYKHRMTLA